ncbi:FtsB family cell division protein [Streptomyces sp. MAR4 CNX-425]|uniref:FtsB family cell division protein n=1 Tax=Streptomyces sp. MAR4 CNX-425 TaxID=3406343 RepID=UPI003B513D18
MRRPRIAFPREGGARLLGGSSAARTPFVLLVVVLLGTGLLALLLLNAAVNQGSFRVGNLKRETTRLTEEEQRLRREVEKRSAPDALEKRARELGMVPGGPPVFLSPWGGVRGEPWTATGPPAPRPADAAEPSPDEADPKAREAGEAEKPEKAEEGEGAEEGERAAAGEPVPPAGASPSASPSPSSAAPPPAAEEAP